MATLGDILIEKGYITKEQLNMSLLEQKRTGKLLGDIFVKRIHLALSSGRGGTRALTATTPARAGTG